MYYFQTPKGEAGLDRLDAMVESIQAAIEQMFWQVAKRDSLSYGVGRSAAKSSDSPNRDMQLDAQRRECDGLIVFHAGKALETTLHIIYAKINNRIPGREGPNVKDGQIQRDRRSHNLEALYDAILESAEAGANLRREIENEFESIYQTVYHQGIHDLIVDGKLVSQFTLPDNTPFREAKMGGFPHGAEITMDHSSVEQLLTPLQSDSDFSRLPWRNFREFLVKADKTYYGRNMRWAHYSARDHELGRPYVVVGTRFFARLVQGLVKLANEQWIWDEKLTRRWHERRRKIIGDKVQNHIQQSFNATPELPDMRSVDEMMDWFRSWKSERTDNYESLHAKWSYQSMPAIERKGHRKKNHPTRD